MQHSKVGLLSLFAFDELLWYVVCNPNAINKDAFGIHPLTKKEICVGNVRVDCDVWTLFSGSAERVVLDTWDIESSLRKGTTDFEDIFLV